MSRYKLLQLHAAGPDLRFAAVDVRTGAPAAGLTLRRMNDAQPAQLIDSITTDADGIGEVGNARCGDIMKIYLKIKDGIIEDVKFNTFGCGSAIASSSMATELIKGKPLSQALELTNKAVAEALDGLPAHKMHCSVLAEEAIRAAIKDYYDKNGIEYDKSLFPEPDEDHEIHED